MRFSNTTLALVFSFLTAAGATPALASSADGKIHGPAKTTTTAATSRVFTKSAEYSQFNHLLVNANMKRILNRTSETYTVFAPTNAAVLRVPANVRTRMFVDGNPGLRQLVYRHMVAGNIDFDQLADGAEIKTLSGEVLRVAKCADGSILLNGVYRVTSAGQTTANGTVYTIDSMIAPTN
ncbi:MAG: fasciclin domain-containing protein [Hymenobacteraceae bacterium]|nr:fasciclin domain-containing protein [Hymenobacteraceae bacterium]